MFQRAVRLRSTPDRPRMLAAVAAVLACIIGLRQAGHLARAPPGRSKARSSTSPAPCCPA